VSIERSGRTRVVRVLGDLDGTVALGDAVGDVRRRLAALGPPPAGVDLSIEGSSQQMGTSFRSLAVALAIAVALVYMVMASQFENLISPLIVMGSVPFAVIGLVGALLLTNTTFSILAFAGGILLVGIVVNNAIVLIDYMETLRARGVGLIDAIIAAGRTRLKPILMTSMTTVLGLLPMSLGIGAGAELRYPMGRAVVGGLITSTAITLVLIPVLYAVVEGRIRPGIARRRAERAEGRSSGRDGSTAAAPERDGIPGAGRGVAPVSGPIAEPVAREVTQEDV
jgi:HAE1 family hydrophobic/amphiphilic exporter-1